MEKDLPLHCFAPRQLQFPPLPHDTNDILQHHSCRNAPLLCDSPHSAYAPSVTVIPVAAAFMIFVVANLTAQFQHQRCGDLGQKVPYDHRVEAREAENCNDRPERHVAEPPQ